MSVIFLFIDGVGLGEENPNNPFFNREWKGFTFMSGGQPFSNQAESVCKEDHLFKGVDATLGVDGLPQSGTGQAVLFSGENAAEIIGKHFGPYPHSGIKHLLEKKSLFHKAKQKGKSCSFINAYPDVFFSKARGRSRWTCTTLMAKSADISLNGEREVKAGKAVTAGLTQKAWKEQLGINVPKIKPEQASRRLLDAAATYDILLHEYYLTDKAGHSQEMERAKEVIDPYDRFLMELIEQKPEKITIVLCSDHGNVEDLSTKMHTYNKVPLFAIGPGATAFHQAKSIMDVTPGILKIL